MEKKENWISSAGALEKIFWQNNEKTFLLLQLPRKKGLVPNKVLKLLNWLWRKEIGKLGPLRTATGLGAKARDEDEGKKPYHQEAWVSSEFH